MTSWRSWRNNWYLTENIDTILPYALKSCLKMMEVASGDNWSYKTCKAPVKSSPPTNQHPVFLQAGCPSCLSTDSVKALKEKLQTSELRAESKHFLWIHFCQKISENQLIRYTIQSTITFFATLSYWPLLLSILVIQKRPPEHQFTIRVQDSCKTILSN